ncbi:hypothetical protein PIB30_075976 [Stylosanthes scabra]|uniref:Uncharacterized protein n=1 Tax=Stylosanthes scabra TaxID=79078 RepID=A0ABU6RQF0_9FABA|nr:hypothetical protein [Stylosanthes scabra]
MNRRVRIARKGGHSVCVLIGDDALDNDEDEEETEELTNQVLDEIGVDVASQLSAAPKGRIQTKNTENVSSSRVDDLEKRLAALRNP